MRSIMERCNDQKMASRKVSEGCERIFFSLFLKKKMCTTRAIVMELNANEIWLISPEFNFDRRIKFKEIKSIIYDSINYKDNQTKLKFKLREQVIEHAFEKLSQIDILLGAIDTFPIDMRVRFLVKQKD